LLLLVALANSTPPTIQAQTVTAASVTNVILDPASKSATIEVRNDSRRAVGRGKEGIGHALLDLL
jgi:hypothetical protein